MKCGDRARRVALHHGDAAAWNSIERLTASAMDRLDAERAVSAIETLRRVPAWKRVGYVILDTLFAK